MQRHRRNVLRFGLCAFVGGPAALLVPTRSAASGDDRLFDATAAADVVGGLGVPPDDAPDAVALTIEDHVDNAGSVPVRIDGRAAGASRLALVVDRNPWPYIARFDFQPPAVPYVALRIRIAESTQVRAVARATDGAMRAVGRRVSVVGGGCSDSDVEDAAPPDVAAMPVRIRARPTPDGGADLLAALTHPMENGLRKTRSGRVLAAHYIHTLQVRLNGTPVVSARLGRSVATNPQIGLRLAAASPGDVVEFAWEDSLGLRRADQARIAG